MRTYKLRSTAPVAYQRILDGVNALNTLPLTDEQIESELIAIAQKEANADFAVATSSRYKTRVRNSIERLIGKKGPVHDYVLGGMALNIMPNIAAMHFNQLRMARILLRRIATINAFADVADAAQRAMGLANVFRQSMQKSGFPGSYTLDSRGCVKSDIEGLPKVLLEYDIPLDRIRTCPVCQNLFWPAKSNAKTCGEPKCVESRGSSSYHRANKEEVNKNKRRRYYEKNGVPYCPVCVTPLSTHGESDCPTNGAN